MMQLLCDKIRNEAKYLGGGIIKVDSFMNHQIDPVLMKKVGEELAAKFKATNPTRILTAETSGIAPALATAMVLEVPFVYARKHQPITMKGEPFREVSHSHTHQKEVELIVSSEYLSKSDRVLIVDDFLATAKTILSLVALVEKSGAELVGIASVIEKAFEGGREKLSHLNIPIESLAKIAAITDGNIDFC